MKKKRISPLASQMGKIGGRARMRRMTKEQRREFARQGGLARWGGKTPEQIIEETQGPRDESLKARFVRGLGQLGITILKGRSKCEWQPLNPASGIPPATALLVAKVRSMAPSAKYLIASSAGTQYLGVRLTTDPAIFVIDQWEQQP